MLTLTILKSGWGPWLIILKTRAKAALFYVRGIIFGWLAVWVPSPDWLCRIMQKCDGVLVPGDIYIVTAVLWRIKGKWVTYVLPTATAGQPHVFVSRWHELSNWFVLLIACLDIETSELLIRETGNLNWNKILSALVLQQWIISILEIKSWVGDRLLASPQHYYPTRLPEVRQSSQTRSLCTVRLSPASARLGVPGSCSGTPSWGSRVPGAAPAEWLWGFPW